MKKLILGFIISLLFLSSFSMANDGVFYAKGNTLIPLQETQVSLKKELLKFYVRDFKYMDVEIDFEFYNPGKAKTVTVGFVTPPADGDVTEEEQKHPKISGFTVLVNGKNIPYKIKKMKDTSFKMGDMSVRGNDFVYYFPVTFKRGTNKIRHTYRFLGGMSVETQRNFDYQITTGKRWANKQIDDFELQVHLDNGVYFIPASFRKDEKLADWKIVGDGVISPTPRAWFGEDNPKIRMAHLNHGYLKLREKKFKPDNDILIGEYNWAAGWVSRWCDFAKECTEPQNLKKVVPYFDLSPWEGHTEEELAELSPLQLRYIRNYFFAVRGYDFKDKQIKNFYSQFFWYKPDKKLKPENINLSEGEKQFIAKVLKVEQSRR